MSYLVLARKYRPQDFITVTGQEHVTRTLSNAIKRDKVAHAHLFCGPRGVGKTSIARIFAKALNCSNGPTSKPCLECFNCKEIAAGTSLAVREIDGASHNSVDNVRDLIDSFRSLPPPGSRYKIYIIDEVHMLSMAAFNALLKSLEEPPPNTIFILATTESHKIPETVISRCVRHDFRALSHEQIDSRLREVTNQEKLDIEPEVIRMITRLADGSMRDAQSLLDRVQSFCEGKITGAEASLVLGTVERALLVSLAAAVLKRDVNEALNLIGEVFSRGVDPGVFLKEFVTIWREILITKFSGERGALELGLSIDEAKELVSMISKSSPHDIQDLVHLAREGADSALRSVYTKYALESLIVRMTTRVPVDDIGALLDNLKSSATNAPSRSIAQTQNATPVRTTSPRVLAPKQDVSTAVSLSQTDAPAVLSWEAFVQHAMQNGDRILSEHCRRLSIDKFTPGLIEAKGPKFNVTSLENKDTQDKFKRALISYSKVQAWNIRLVVSETDAAPGSLVHAEKEAAVKKRKATEQEVLNHPKLKSLQKVFPGSSIEDIKVRDN